MIKTSPYHPALALGGVFLSLFGAAWLSGASYKYAGASLPLLLAIAAVSLLISGWAIMTYRSRRREYPVAVDAARSKRVRKGMLIVNIAQWWGIGIAILLLNLTGHAAWILPCVILFVGLHFFPLARILNYRGYNLTAAALVLVAVAYMLFGGEGQSVALSLLATGAILWASAIALLCAM
jgi:hypothetical protein